MSCQQAREATRRDGPASSWQAATLHAILEADRAARQLAAEVLSPVLVPRRRLTYADRVASSRHVRQRHEARCS